ncbi:MAG: hypothetical protein WA709_29820 [Stellaceae bacterium]
MSNLLKSAVLSLGVLAGTAAVALAQSVSALPPSSPATGPTAATPPASTYKIFPNPGNNTTWQEERAQPTAGYEADKSQHPYSTSIGPQPGSHSSGKDEHYQASDGDNAPSRHPYTSNFGPKPN